MISFFSILVFIFSIMCLFLCFIILLQKTKSSLGLGAMGGGTQMLFGGSGGQDLFQKTTWVLGALFMAGSLTLASMKKPTSASSALLNRLSANKAANIQIPTQPQSSETVPADVVA